MKKLEWVAQRGGQVETLKKEPHLYPDLWPVWDIFHHLHLSRATGFGVSPISASDILAALRLEQVPRGLWSEYYALISALDRRYLRYEAKRLESKKSNGKT